MFWRTLPGGSGQVEERGGPVRPGWRRDD